MLSTGSFLSLSIATYANLVLLVFVRFILVEFIQGFIEPYYLRVYDPNLILPLTDYIWFSKAL